MKSLGTIWVCQCCMLTHANGECCSDLYYGQDPDHDPLGLISHPSWVSMGMTQEEHSCGRQDDTHFGECDGECDCEINTFSTSRCEGCGSWLHGERHAMTLWKD